MMAAWLISDGIKTTCAAAPLRISSTPLVCTVKHDNSCFWRGETGVVLVGEGEGGERG